MARQESIVYRTLDGNEARLPLVALRELNARVRGGVSMAGDPAYELARQVWNGMVDRHPAAIVHCLAAQDVREAVRFAREHAMLLSVRGGGHHIAGNAVAERGLTIDLSPMRGVRVDPVRRTARASGGARLGDVDHETQAFGLATPLGVNSTTGLGGLCLGGGFGWLTRMHGLTIDNLVSADVVTADGELRVASGPNDPDLFWAIRGGGGNFGVVTSFELKLHHVGPLVYAGFVVYPLDQAAEVLRGWRDFDDAAPEELSVWAVLRRAPPLPFLPPRVHGSHVVVLAGLYSGDVEDGARVMAPLLRLGEPAGSALGAQPYVAFQQALDPLLVVGARNYWKTNEFEELDDGVIDVLIDGARAAPGPECELLVAHLGGAMGRIPTDATAYAGRHARYVLNVHGRWQSPTEDAAVRAWARSVFDSTAGYATGGGYVNFLSADETARVTAAYGGNYERLRELKRRFDPDNLFRMNHNIPPDGSEPRPVGRRTRGAARSV